MTLVSITGTFIGTLRGLPPEKPGLLLDLGSKVQETTLDPASKFVGMTGLELVILNIADWSNKRPTLSLSTFKACD